jgi:hypothetical protein
MTQDHDDDYEEHIKRLVDQAPPLTQRQRDRIAAAFADVPDPDEPSR